MIASYRLQLHPDFGFENVRALVPYFRKLGISHLYLSPITEARRGSTHGYDVVDHNSVREALGGRDGFERLADECADAGLKIILDFVPNHAGVGPRNAYWQDVLAFGPHSRHARVFDIEWAPLKPELTNRILLPFLGRTYGEVLDDDELGLSYSDGHFYATYYENRFALAPASYHHILGSFLPRFEREEAYFDLKHLVDAYQSLEPHEIEKAGALRSRLIRMLEDVAVEDLLSKIDRYQLHQILEIQFWRLSYWKTASFEINYRRFFDINELVALRMEDDEVFWDAHHLLAELTAHPAVEGVRIDHVDGLADPHHYLQLLTDVGPKRIWVEKILAPGETLPDEWPVAGTTGYEFMNDVMGLLVDEEGLMGLERTYRRHLSSPRLFDDEVYASKRLVMETSLSSELFRLSYELDRISEADYHTRDFTLQALSEALKEIVAALDRYRTYLPHDEEEAAEVIGETVYRARSRNPTAEPTVYEFIRRIMLGDVREDLRPMQRAWTRRLQQYCAPVAAKGVEDTAFYRYHRLAALNEVGGEPGHFSQSLQAFHSRCRFRALRYPQTLLATATHDHKRGEDTRMRLVALSESADLWEQTVQSLSEIGDDYRNEAGPADADAYLFYQMLVALWEDSDHDELPDRLWTYMLKASREAKERTSWIQPEETYEDALEAFVRGITGDERTGEAIGQLARRIADLGFRNSITQLVLKLMTPGVPDIYQGTELWDLSMVDPDNRREVDYELRGGMIDSLANDSPEASDLLAWASGRDIRLKLLVMHRLLAVRFDVEDFDNAGYHELKVAGEGANHWVAFLRETPADAVLVVARRYFGSDAADASLEIPDEYRNTGWRSILDESQVDVSDTLTLVAEEHPWAVYRRQ